MFLAKAVRVQAQAVPVGELFLALPSSGIILLEQGHMDVKGHHSKHQAQRSGRFSHHDQVSLLDKQQSSPRCNTCLLVSRLVLNLLKPISGSPSFCSAQTARETIAVPSGRPKFRAICLDISTPVAMAALAAEVEKSAVHKEAVLRAFLEQAPPLHMLLNANTHVAGALGKRLKKALGFGVAAEVVPLWLVLVHK